MARRVTHSASRLQAALKTLRKASSAWTVLKCNLRTASCVRRASSKFKEFSCEPTRFLNASTLCLPLLEGLGVSLLQQRRLLTLTEPQHREPFPVRVRRPEDCTSTQSRAQPCNGYTDLITKRSSTMRPLHLQHELTSRTLAGKWAECCSCRGKTTTAPCQRLATTASRSGLQVPSTSMALWPRRQVACRSAFGGEGRERRRSGNAPPPLYRYIGKSMRKTCCGGTRNTTPQCIGNLFRTGQPSPTP
mmetsp:Transcript_10137/g.25993  ORF Transcript_10137/g.25993 Transcript_10137/m.25993 type:complete len:247 (-) Transcript_10137:960-1700(-)